MNVLCVAAHPDDEVLGVGGTLARHADNGDDVHVCILANGVTARYDDINDKAHKQIEHRRNRALKACNTLGVSTTSFHQFPDNEFDSIPLLEVVQTIEAEIDEYDPDVIYTHHYGDLNVDHELACRATVTATRPLKDSKIARVLAFETLSATEWSVPSSKNAFQPQHFVNIKEQLDAKLDALAIYEDELREAPHPRTIDPIERTAQVWGAKVGVPAAEPFEVLREIER
jgi:LmbE family N-acetylglucosaminyl deacetylase